MYCSHDNVFGNIKDGRLRGLWVLPLWIQRDSEARQHELRSESLQGSLESLLCKAMEIKLGLW